MAKAKAPAVPQRHFVGSHMSSAGGVERAVERGVTIGCSALQLFVKNNNRWVGPPISEASAAAFKAALPKAGIRPEHTFAHSSYLINLASEKEEVVARSIVALEDELRRCNQLGILGLVMHPGSAGAAGDSPAALARVAKFSREILKKAGGSTRLLFETTAGTGATLGAKFEEIAGLLDETNLPSRVGVCLDTCHIFAAGYDIRDAATFKATFDSFEKTVGLKRLLAIHLNDSKMPFASRRDRHEHIGKGEIGPEAFRLLLNDPRFDAIPMALETEKDEALDFDRENLALLAKLESDTGKRKAK